MSSPLRKSKVGVAGLGIIGSRVAKNLARQGYGVWVWNRTPKPFPCFLGSPKDLAEHAETVLLFLKDGSALLEVLAAMAPALTPNHLVINHSTILPDHARQAAALVGKKGSAFLDAPFTGSRDAAEKNEMVYYLGGSEETIARARPLLECSAKEILCLGGVGDASLLKIATNMVTAATVAALGEALALTESAGISGENFSRAIAHNASNSATVQMKLPAMLAGDFAPRFSLQNMAKDIRMAKSLLEGAGIPPRMMEAFLQHAQTAEEAGRQEEDFSVLYRMVSEAAHGA